MNNTIIISCHHRRSRFFEETVTALWDNGYKEIWIQDTGLEKCGKYQGPYTQYRKLGHRSYDQGLVAFREWLPPAKINKYRNVFLLDNDCFCTPEAMTKYIKAFEEGGYGWASHLVHPTEYRDHWTFKDDIAEVFDQEIKPADIYPGVVPSPHYENAFSLFTTEVWQNIEPKYFSHGRLLLKAIHDKEYKMGAHRAQYRGQYSHFEDGWFHVGNLMRFYTFLEANDYSIFKPDNQVAMERLGYFFHHGRFLMPRLNDGELKRIAMEKWEALIKDTVMDGWK